jgi:RNA polymerase sigma-70 factor (ECF subfamily)
MKTSEQIWQDYHNGLLGFIHNRVGNRELAEDLLQDVFVKIHSRLETLSDAERVQGWVYSIARNAIIDHYRVRKSSEPLPPSLDDLAAEPDDGDAVWRELEECLRPMIEYLPTTYREPLLLAEFDGLALKEVAERLGLSLSGAKSRVQRGRAKLKELMLTCCHFEFDSRGKPISYKNDCDCNPC